LKEIYFLVRKTTFEIRAVDKADEEQQLHRAPQFGGGGEWHRKRRWNV